MYIPKPFKEDRIEVLHRLIVDRPLAALVTLGPEGLIASHIPFLLDPHVGRFGTLGGHLARANPQWRDFSSQVDALVIFNGPQHYISPAWYPSRAEHGRVVPTWNYIVVHAYGPLRIVDDTRRLLPHLRELTKTHEAGIENPWSLDEAPQEFIESMLGSIVGIEIEIRRLEGKWKLSQNRVPADRRGATAGLRRRADPDALAIVERIESMGS